VKLIADLNIAPRTVAFLRSRGHDVVRVDDVLAPTAVDQRIVDFARADGRTVLTHDLDFSAIVALSGESVPSIISLRLRSARVEIVNRRLEAVLSTVESEVLTGAIVTVEDDTVRCRLVPIT